MMDEKRLRDKLGAEGFMPKEIDMVLGVIEEAKIDFWIKSYVADNKLCSLCGNTGVIDTRETAVSFADVNSGRLNWCLCPNGEALRKVSKDRPPDGMGYSKRKGG
jgi:hypothetical protein